MKIALSIALLFASVAVNANESGILYQGKKYVLFKDGKKVGEEPDFARKPASLRAGSWLSIRYEEDSQNGVICYYNDDAPDHKADISCVKR